MWTEERMYRESDERAQEEKNGEEERHLGRRYFSLIVLSHHLLCSPKCPLSNLLVISEMSKEQHLFKQMFLKHFVYKLADLIFSCGGMLCGRYRKNGKYYLLYKKRNKISQSITLDYKFCSAGFYLVFKVLFDLISFRMPTTTALVHSAFLGL